MEAVLKILGVFFIVSTSQAKELIISGSVIHMGNNCKNENPVSVHFLGPTSSPNIILNPGERETIGLSPGFYDMLVQSLEGVIIEETKALLHEGGFILPVGCSKPVRLPSQGKGKKKVRFANTSKDCGSPIDVTFYVNGTMIDSVSVGREITADVPDRDVVVESYSQNNRLLVQYFASLKDTQIIYYGCTDPSFASGVSVMFQNTTNLCDGNSKDRYLTLWVDGMPIKGIMPGTSSIVMIPKGKHYFEVMVAFTREKVLSGAKEVLSPFRIHFGCGR